MDQALEYYDRLKDVLLGCTSCLKTSSTLSLNGRKFKARASLKWTSTMAQG